MHAQALHTQPLPPSSLGGPFRRALSALAVARAFLLWAARCGFFNTWPV
jgi:hypothetical protein